MATQTRVVIEAKSYRHRMQDVCLEKVERDIDRKSIFIFFFRVDPG